MDKSKKVDVEGTCLRNTGNRKKEQKGNGDGRMVMEKQEGIEMKKEDGKGREEGIMTGIVSLEKEWWRLVEVYVNKDLKEKMEKLRE